MEIAYPGKPRRKKMLARNGVRPWKRRQEPSSKSKFMLRTVMFGLVRLLRNQTLVFLEMCLHQWSPVLHSQVGGYFQIFPELLLHRNTLERKK